MTVLLSQFSFGMFLMAMLLTMASIFMILLILVQQGRGGGLTGALGGMGGQSAFGTKAGDLFTRITIVTAIIWILLSVITIWLFNRPPVTGPAPPPASLGLPETESDLPAEADSPQTPPQAEADKSAGEGVNLNPPADAVPSEPKPAEPAKEGEPKDNAAPNTESADKSG